MGYWPIWLNRVLMEFNKNSNSFFIIKRFIISVYFLRWILKNLKYFLFDYWGNMFFISLIISYGLFLRTLKLFVFIRTKKKFIYKNGVMFHYRILNFLVNAAFFTKNFFAFNEKKTSLK